MKRFIYYLGAFLVFALDGTCPTGQQPFTLNLPTTQGSLYQVMGLIDGNGDLGWITTVTNLNQTSMLATATSVDIPLTLVLRDKTGSFVATNVTITGATVYEAANGGFIFIAAPSSVTTYTITFPTTHGGSGTALLNDGAGNLSWLTTITGGIETINGQRAALQYLATSTLGTVFGWSTLGTVGTTTSVLNIPYAANLGTTSNAFGIISGADYTNFENTYTTLLTATSSDIPNTLVKRDSTGSFAATTVTVTGAVLYQARTNGGTVSLSAPAVVTAYALTLPTAQATAANQLLVNNGSGQLSWASTATAVIQSINGQSAVQEYVTTSTLGTTFGWSAIGTATNQLNIPYAANLGSSSAVGLIAGADYTNFENTYTTVLSAASADIVNRLVKRDGSGSFNATNVTVTGALVFQGQGGQLSLTATTLPANQTLVFPTVSPVKSQALSYSGNNQLSWVTTLTGGIQSINGQTAAQQYLSTSTTGLIVGFTSIATATNQLTIPYAGNLGTNNNQFGLISGLDYTNFENSYTTVLSATASDIINRLVKRDGTGSFVASNLTLTGALTFQGGTSGAVSISAPSTLVATYTLVLPTSQGAAGSVLADNGSGQLSWVANLASGTTCDAPLNMVLRDTSGSFIATTVTLTGNSLINYTYLGLCDTGSQCIFAPKNGNTIIGLAAYSSALTTGSDNTIFGQGAGSALSTGNYNTLFGYQAGTQVSSYYYNTIVGYQAGASGTGSTGSNTVVGATAGSTIGGSSGINNTIVGFNAGSITTAANNVVVGAQAGTSLLTGTANVILGANAQKSVTSYYNVTVGCSAQVGSGSNNIAIGGAAGNSSASGYDNVMVGYQAGSAIITGTANVFLGSLTNGVASGSLNTCIGHLATGSGNYNVAVGYAAAAGINTSYNVALGYTASAVAGTGNVVAGYQTVAGASNTASNNNVVIGAFAGYSPATSVVCNSNVFIGYFAAQSIPSNVSSSVAIGTAAGSSISGTNSILLGDNAGLGLANLNNIIYIGSPSGNSSNCYIYGIYGTGVPGSFIYYNSSTGQVTTTLSSRRFKKNIQPMGARTDNLINLEPVTFSYIADETNELQYGLIAEQVEPYYPELISYDKDGHIYSVKYRFLPMMLLNECQKVRRRIVALTDEIDKLQKKIMSLVGANE